MIFKLLLPLFAFLYLNVHGEATYTDSMDNTTTYKIDGKEVSEEVFNKRLKSLMEIKKTWYCKSTVAGGCSGYDARDLLGRRYTYKCDTKNSKSVCSIERKKTD